MRAYLLNRKQIFGFNDAVLFLKKEVSESSAPITLATHGGKNWGYAGYLVGSDGLRFIAHENELGQLKKIQNLPPDYIVIDANMLLVKRLELLEFMKEAKLYSIVLENSFATVFKKTSKEL